MHEGLYHLNKIMGYGRMFYEDGEVYIGEFNNGIRHGQGMQISPFKKVVRGVWKNDEFLREDNTPLESPREEKEVQVDEKESEEDSGDSGDEEK